MVVNAMVANTIVAEVVRLRDFQAFRRQNPSSVGATFRAVCGHQAGNDLTQRFPKSRDFDYGIFYNARVYSIGTL